MRMGRPSWQAITGALVATLCSAISQAQPSTEKSGGSRTGVGPSMADFMKLQNEVREQRQLIVQMMQSEQQRYEMLLKLLRTQGGSATASSVIEVPRPSVAKSDGDDDTLVEPTSEGSGAGRSKAGVGGGDRPRRNGSVAGHVGLSGGGAATDVYVFIDNVKAAPVHGKTIEIRQQNKQFTPRLAVVQTGTSVVFPNLDTVYHNVFSNSPRNTFDLGSSRAGDTPRAVTLSKPGVVEVFCNMHQKMSANVLVVPGPLYTKVRPDGTFKIDNVPVGARKVVAWSPGTKSAEQQVDVTAGGAQVTFALQADEQRSHLNKTGQAYGSYRE